MYVTMRYVNECIILLVVVVVVADCPPTTVMAATSKVRTASCRT